MLICVPHLPVCLPIYLYAYVAYICLYTYACIRALMYLKEKLGCAASASPPCFPVFSQASVALYTPQTCRLQTGTSDTRSRHKWRRSWGLGPNVHRHVYNNRVTLKSRCAIHSHMCIYVLNDANTLSVFTTFLSFHIFSHTQTRTHIHLAQIDAHGTHVHVHKYTQSQLLLSIYTY